jgi:hypothetical protein
MHNFPDHYNPGSGLPEDMERSMHDSIRAHHEERRRQQQQDYKRKRASRSSSSRGKATNNDDGVSDVRAIHHMDQSRRKSEIVYNKLNKARGSLDSDKSTEFENAIKGYIELERVVARYLQQTSDEFGKARTLNTKEARLAQIEKARKAKNDRIDLEKSAREAARDKFNSIRDELDSILQKQEL